ncbi:enoyl-CoA hydratase [Alcanivorax sp. N3-2A]|nr:enoyl-CoA hydratase [Alcanivorax sp. N3-2A]|tara:strand:- start:14737 stop:15510 length:774 start_codon:yes stop_codon:yes gene_type:complete
MSELDLKSGFIRVTEHGKLLEATLDRADKLNALTLEMYRDLSRVVDHFQARDDLTALLIDGEGRSFTAGNDLKDFRNADPKSRENGKLSPAMDFVFRLRALDKPVIMAVHGNATGIGTTMLLHCDLVIAAENTRFYTAFINLGLVPEAGSSFLLQTLVGRQNANRLLLAGDTLNAEEAERMGLVAYRVADDQLREKALELGQTLAAKPPQAIAYTKQLMRLHDDAVKAQIEAESKRFAERMFSDEVRAIFDKFLNKK